MEPSRILYLENGTSGGGSFESLTQLVTHLNRQQYEPIVVFVNDTPYRETLRSAGIPTHCLTDALYSVASPQSVRRGSSYMVSVARYVPVVAPSIEALVHRSSVRALVQMIRTNRVSLLHCNNNPVRDAYGIIVARTANIPVICHLRSVRVATIPTPFAAWMARSVRHCIANSAFSATWWHDAVGIPIDRITVVPNPVRVESVTPADVHRAWRIPESAPVICCVANFTVGKGHGLLLEAFARVRSEIPTAYLLCVGDGPLHADIAAQAATLGIAASVRFAGYVPNARTVIAGCDVLAVPSETETFGRVIVEAMGVGTPVVATRVGGIPELIRHGENGALIPPDDFAAFAAALVRVLRDRTFAGVLRAGGHAMIATGAFDPAVHASRVAAVYDGVRTRVPV